VIEDIGAGLVEGFIDMLAKAFLCCRLRVDTLLPRMLRNAAENKLGVPADADSQLDGPLHFGLVKPIRRHPRHIEIERPEQRHLIFVVKRTDGINLPGADLQIEVAECRQRRGELSSIAPTHTKRPTALLRRRPPG
jgi:hypothetical protein